MNTIEKDKLLLYLKDAIDQETAIVQQQNLITEYNTLSAKRVPVQTIIDKPAAPVKTEVTIPNALKVIGVILLCVGIFLLIMGYAMVSNDESWIQDYKRQLADKSDRSYSYMKDYYERQLMEYEASKDSNSVLVTIGWLCSAGAGAIYLFNKYKKAKADQAHSIVLSSYNNECNKIIERNQQYQNEYKKNMSMWEKSNREMNSYMDKPLEEAKSLLENFYSTDTIYEKYRNLPALTSIYEYFITGRCEELIGPHGAYNMYEDELRKDTIINRLDTVIENLEQIKQNQYMLYQQIKGVQENTNRIVSELQQIKGYTVSIAQLTALNAYYAARTERNTRISMYYNL